MKQLCCYDARQGAIIYAAVVARGAGVTGRREPAARLLFQKRFNDSARRPGIIVR